MMICYGCRGEMRCVQTGQRARWGRWVKSGDAYACPTCGAQVVYVQPQTEGYEADPRPGDLTMEEASDAR